MCSEPLLGVVHRQRDARACPPPLLHLSHRRRQWRRSPEARRGGGGRAAEPCSHTRHGLPRPPCHATPAGKTSPARARVDQASAARSGRDAGRHGHSARAQLRQQGLTVADTEATRSSRRQSPEAGRMGIGDGAPSSRGRCAHPRSIRGGLAAAITGRRAGLPAAFSGGGKAGKRRGGGRAAARVWSPRVACARATRGSDIELLYSIARAPTRQSQNPW